MTKTKPIRSLQTEQITPEGTTGDATGEGVEATPPPMLSPCRQKQRNREMGFIVRDGEKIRPRGEEGVHPHISGV